jgi:HK97 family phage prohead protease
MNLEEKIKSGRQYRTMQMSAKEDEEYRVQGYATTFNEPYLLYEYDDVKVYEQVSEKAFDDCDMSDVIMQYDHEGRVFARLSNNTLELNVDDKGLLINAYLGGTQLGRGLYEDIKGGYITKMSFGFTVDEDEIEEVSNEEGVKVTRTITKIGKLYDVSAVSIPANDATEISARNYCDGVIAEIEAERLQRAEKEKRIKKLKLQLELERV